MAVASRAVDLVPRQTVTRWPTVGILSVTGTKLADAVTTAVALTFLPLVELNPVVRVLIAQAGVVPGVLIGSGLVIGFITVVTESGVYACGRLSADAEGVAGVRYAGYGLPTALFAAASLHNLSLMLLVI